MASLGVPVPPGFTLSTTVARAFLENEVFPNRLKWQLKRGINALEQKTGKKFGNPDNSLLVSVRSGAAVSMPGMMDTVLNLGLNPETTAGLGKILGARVAWDCYRRFLVMFGDVVLGIDHNLFDKILKNVRIKMQIKENRRLTVAGLKLVCDKYRTLIKKKIGRSTLDDPWAQLELTIRGVLRSWNSNRALIYRREHKIPDWMGTAVNVQAMVFGNQGEDSCTGVVFSRNVATGEPKLFGEWLMNAQGEDIVAGIRTPLPIDTMKEWNPTLFHQLEKIVQELERKYCDVVDVEFTVEGGKLYVLQCRKAKRTPEAAMTIAVHMLWEKRWSKETAIKSVDPKLIEQVYRPGFETSALEEAESSSFLTEGLPASPGAAVGKAVFSTEKAIEMAGSGEKVVLIRHDTKPDDLGGMLNSVAIVTARGGTTSHAAVVARGLGKPAVVGAYLLNVGESAARSNTRLIEEGEIISVDGTTGKVFVGEIPLRTSVRKKEIDIFLKWTKQSMKFPNPRLGFEWVEKKGLVYKFLNDFYLSDALASAAEGTALENEALVIKKRIHTEVAECIAAYLVLAVAGELRHRCRCTKCSEIKEIKPLMEKWGLAEGGDRHYVQMSFFSKLRCAGLIEHVDFLQMAVVAFQRCCWKPGYGGKRWAAIALSALSFLTGELNHSVFADHAFDLQHNNGSVFGKHPMLSGDRYVIREQLNKKKEASSPIGLFYILNSIYEGFSPIVSTFWEKGLGLGIWRNK
jgi:phosphohistidine swiveling domain-containing protein